MKLKKCRKCEKEFNFASVQDLDCHDCKLNADIKSSNKNWLERKPKKRSKAVTNNIAYAFFYPGSNKN